jgi:hypothetical protein
MRWEEGGKEGRKEERRDGLKELADEKEFGWVVGEYNMTGWDGLTELINVQRGSA